ncbi:MAG TPA: CvpA family protein [Candidatus Acidoferrum sp.]|nr:CvpA family protein [Candidatus Acidoferrum sp.]
MATADILVLLIIGISCLLGVFRGLVKETLSLVFWIGGVIVAGLFSTRVGSWLAGAISSVALQKMVAFVLIFIVVVFIGALISNLLSSLLSKAGLGAANRALGGVFGLVRGVVIITVIVMLTQRFGFTKDFYQQSYSVPYVTVLANKAEQWFGMKPDESEIVRDAIKSA